MKRVLLFLSLLVIFSSATSALEYVYDNFEDNTLNTSIFNFVRSTSCDGGTAWTEVGGRASATCTSTLGNWKLALQVLNVKNWSDQAINFSINWSRSATPGAYMRIGFANLTTNAGDEANMLWQLDYYSVPFLTRENNVISWYPNDTAVQILINSTLVGAIKHNGSISMVPTIFITDGGGQTASLSVSNVNVSYTTFVVLNSPTNKSTRQQNSITLNATGLSGTSLSNMTFFLYNATGLVNTTVRTITNGQNTSTLTISNLNYGTYKWSAAACSTNLQSEICYFAQNNTFYLGLGSTSYPYNATTYETKRETFKNEITFNAGQSFSSATLTYGSRSYAASFEDWGDNNGLLSVSLDVPLGAANNSFYWTINLNGLTAVLENEYQPSAEINLSICGAAPYHVPYINFTFRDEGNNSALSAFIPTSTWNYYLGSGSVNKTYIFSNISATNPSYAFCFAPKNVSVTSTVSLQYEATGYPQRIYNPSVLSLSNSTSNKVLYLLDSSSGIYVTFQVINAAEQPLSGVNANVTRTINGETAIVGSGISGSDGGVTFWLNPDFVHTACFLLSPFPVFCSTQAFTQSSYTINLGGTATSASTNNYFTGITKSFQPAVTYLSNGTMYNFNFTINSSYWSLSSFGFNITNGSGSLVGTASGSGNSGGFVGLNLNTGQNETFYVTYYWIINNTITSQSRTYLILDLSGNSFSIARLISDLGTYLSLGFFGINDFGIGIICFILIVGSVGMMKMKFGLSDEAVLFGIIFALVALLDVSFNILPNPVGSVENFPTIFVGIVFLGFMYKEVFQ